MPWVTLKREVIKRSALYVLPLQRRNGCKDNVK